MRAPDDAKPPVIDFYTGISFSADAVIKARNAFETNMRAFRTALDSKNTVSLKQAAENAAREARQASILLDVIAGVAAKHINRRTRT